MKPPRPSEALLDQYRAHRMGMLMRGSSLYPYAMGRVEGVLTGPGRPSDRIKEALLQIAALDIVSAEPLPPMPESAE